MLGVNRLKRTIWLFCFDLGRAFDKTERAIRRVRAPSSRWQKFGVPGKIIGQTPIVIDDRLVGEDYGTPLQNAFEQSNSAQSKEGLLLDPVYTGKAMAGLLTLVRENYFTANVRNLLF